MKPIANQRRVTISWSTLFILIHGALALAAAGILVCGYLSQVGCRLVFGPHVILNDAQRSNALSFIVGAFTNSDDPGSRVLPVQDQDRDDEPVWEHLRNMQSDMEQMRVLMASMHSGTNDGQEDV